MTRTGWRPIGAAALLALAAIGPLGAGAAPARPLADPPVKLPVEVYNDGTHPVPISGAVQVTGAADVKVANQPDVNVANRPDVNVANNPTVTVGNSPNVIVTNNPTVTVGNTPSVNAKQSGVWNVGIDPGANTVRLDTSGNALPVEVVGGAAQQPFDVSLDRIGASFEVPAGNRAEIDFVSGTSAGGTVDLTAPAYFRPSIQTSVGGLVVHHLLPAQFQDSAINGDTFRIYTFAQQTLFFADPGSTVTLGVDCDQACGGHAVISGYLIPVG